MLIHIYIYVIINALQFCSYEYLCNHNLLLCSQIVGVARDDGFALAPAEEARGRERTRRPHQGHASSSAVGRAQNTKEEIVVGSVVFKEVEGGFGKRPKRATGRAAAPGEEVTIDYRSRADAKVTDKDEEQESGSNHDEEADDEGAHDD